MQNEEIQPQPSIENPALEIERERRKRAELEYKTERSKRETAQRVEETKQELFNAELRRQLASTGLSFHIADSELRTLLERMSGVRFNVQNDGRFRVEQNGTEITLRGMCRHVD